LDRQNRSALALPSPGLICLLLSLLFALFKCCPNLRATEKAGRSPRESRASRGQPSSLRYWAPFLALADFYLYGILLSRG
jgi:hypothetical protein